MTDVSRRVLLDPGNPHDIDPTELDELVDGLRAAATNTDVVAAYRPEDGYGGPYHEVLNVWIEAGGVASTAIVIKQCVAWMKGRWHRDHDEHPPPQRPRPRSLTIYEEETITRKITIDLPNGAAVDTPIGPDETPPHPRPEP